MRYRPYFWLFLLLALAAPAGAFAATPSRDCLAAIHNANAQHKPQLVPADCWRMGPLHLGMTMAQARLLLGTPDSSQSFAALYRRRKYPVTQLLYVYPRNLRNWLRLAPWRLADFHPVTVRLSFNKDVLAALTVRDDVRVNAPSCTAKGAGRYFQRHAADFPYGFHGLTLGQPMASVEPRFGGFAGHLNVAFYWPVPLAVGGADKVQSIDLASGMAFVNRGAPPDFTLDLDPQSCLIRGFSVHLAPGLPSALSGR